MKRAFLGFSLVLTLCVGGALLVAQDGNRKSFPPRDGGNYTSALYADPAPPPFEEVLQEPRGLRRVDAPPPLRDEDQSKPLTAPDEPPYFPSLVSLPELVDATPLHTVAERQHHPPRALLDRPAPPPRDGDRGDRIPPRDWEAPPSRERGDRPAERRDADPPPRRPTPPRPVPPRPAPPRPAPRREQPKEVTEVFCLANTPVVDIAETLGRAMPPTDDDADRVRIVPEVMSNSLIVSGTETALKKVAELIKSLDREPAMVTVDVRIIEVGPKPDTDSPETDDETKAGDETPGASKLGKKFAAEQIDELVAALRESGRRVECRRLHITTLDNQPAFVQAGRKVPTVKATGPRTGQPAIAHEDVGLTVGITPQITEDGMVTMEIDIEHSELAPFDEGIPVEADDSGTVTRLPVVNKNCVQTTVSVGDGRAVSLGGVKLGDGTRDCEMRIFAVPRVH